MIGCTTLSCNIGNPMFIRLVADSFSRRPRHKLLTGAALALGMAVATAALSVSLDVGDRLAREFRSLGESSDHAAGGFAAAGDWRRRLPSGECRRVFAGIRPRQAEDNFLAK